MTTSNPPLQLRPHQEMGVFKTLHLKESHSKVLWGHIQLVVKVILLEDVF